MANYQGCSKSIRTRGEIGWSGLIWMLGWTAGIVYKKITNTNFRLSTPVIPPNLQPFHQQFVNEIAQHGPDYP